MIENWLKILPVFLGLAAPAYAGPVDIGDAWFRALPAGLPAAGYFTAANTTRSDIAITGARSNGCGMLMLHRSSDTGGMSGMAMMEQVNIPAGGVVKFAPGGFHLMCEQPKLKRGARVPVVLFLSTGASVAVAFSVRDAAGR